VPAGTQSRLTVDARPNARSRTDIGAVSRHPRQLQEAVAEDDRGEHRRLTRVAPDELGPREHEQQRNRRPDTELLRVVPLGTSRRARKVSSDRPRFASGLTKSQTLPTSAERRPSPTQKSTQKSRTAGFSTPSAGEKKPPTIASASGAIVRARRKAPGKKRASAG